ncbi:nuclear receptor binding SET domain protein [Anopheles gambiae]|uniref:nuclear receptor binding SET domain protein n=1 Tax=Anopheles gambiae TaxID=7165 RepID=UPI002AC9BAEE|nr:nuclear receptor binding SET domain protein [Anopheles gambiae]XP_061506544.1 nuclear receptor binding SET domain protein [Anopheles gambiae]XP_061506545.1 nuclear receptor binding SET domain protein [Anopheles gambiae]XP_061506546.1 nuclear receptor binding SET domain protein [Anopheles gambiae]XP_316738.6 nuclear receptor binding SET domain protein [Anopheles gambiae]
MPRNTRSREVVTPEMKLQGNATRKAVIQRHKSMKKNTKDTASDRSFTRLVLTSSGNNSKETKAQENLLETAAATNFETDLLSPTTTQKRVKSQESTPQSQKIAKQEPMSGSEMNESGKENAFSDQIRNHPTDENSNTVVRVPGRYLLKQLSSSLSPKMTEINIDTDRRVSRYGRHQKQKDNSDYVPVDLMKYVGSTPSKFKTKSETDDPNSVNKTLETKPHSSDELRTGSNDISLSLTVVPLPLIDGSIMKRPEEKQLLSMEEIKIVGMEEPYYTDKGSDNNCFMNNLLERKTSSDADSGKGSSVDLAIIYRAGNLYWAAQTRKSIHWPCIVHVDPETDQITRLYGDKFLEVHVSYFGDRGRRAWIKEHSILPFEGVDEYCTNAKNMEYGKLLKSALKSERWKNACSIAERYMTLALSERIASFDHEVKLELARHKVMRHRMAIEGRIKNGASQKMPALLPSDNSEVLEHWNKRDRSSSPESPEYELLPGVFPTKNNPIKKIKFSPSMQNCILNDNRSPLDRPLHSMDSEENPPGSATKANGPKATTLGVSDLENLNSTEYDDILTFIRYYMFDGHTSYEVEKGLQLYVRGICNLKKHSNRGTERTVGRQRMHALRKSYEILGIEPSAEVSTSLKTRNAHPVIKKEPKTLEEKFIFELDKNFLMKGVPKGFVCYICNRPNNVTKCSKCTLHLHLVCLANDPEEVVKMQELVDQKKLCCEKCSTTSIVEKTCFICNDEIPEKSNEQIYRCVVGKCTQAYHISCLQLFPQVRQVSASTIICPYHTCHTCVASEPRSTASMVKTTLAHCLKCPTSYHPSGNCIPAGSVLLTTTQLICPKHTLEQIPLNVNWCFICGKGGNLICCETCPLACHPVCLQFTPPDEKYFCEGCESGRLPLYNEIVIAKMGSFRWWPALTLPPSEIPQNMLQLRHKPSDICVKFFNTHDMSWLNRKRMYLYQREDSESLDGSQSGSSMDKRYRSAMTEASKIFKILQTRKMLGPSASLSYSKAVPVYKKIKTNRYIPPLKPPSVNRQLDGVEDSVCRCQPSDDDPCGPTSACLNRAIMMECSSKTCPAKESCSNQRFTKRIYPALEVRFFSDKGFGLVALEDLKSGQFVIEYVGEVINSEEFDRRVMMMQAAKETNYYFLTVEPDLTIDAGPKGNVSRFINHSCEPNCETQKWTIGETRVIGLFAIKDINAGEELTFNYNLESLGNNKRVCLCGAGKCSGFIGEKYRPPNKKDIVISMKSERSLKNGKKRVKIRRTKTTLTQKTTRNLSETKDTNNQLNDNDVVMISAQEAVIVDLVDENASAYPLASVHIKQEKNDYNI